MEFSSGCQLTYNPTSGCQCSPIDSHRNGKNPWTKTKKMMLLSSNCLVIDTNTISRGSHQMGEGEMRGYITSIGFFFFKEPIKRVNYGEKNGGYGVQIFEIFVITSLHEMMT